MSREAAFETASSSSSSYSPSVPAQHPGSSPLVAENKLSVAEAAIVKLEAENAKLKADLIRLEQRAAHLERSLESMEGRHSQREEKLKVKRVPVQVGFFSSSASSPSSSPAILMQPSSPLAPTISGRREVKAEIKEVEQLLQHVAYGEQEEAESLIRRKPALLLCKGNVTDLSKREFKEITGFQYALWGLDWHMWKMLLKYLPKEAAAMQFQELEEQGTDHGKCFSLLPLIEALNRYFEQFYLALASDDELLHAHWCQQVGGAQFLLPVSIVNEYCHPSRPFVPIPSFKEEYLPRRRQWCLSSDHMEEVGDWYTGKYKGGRLGETFGIIRYNLAMPRVRNRNEGPYSVHPFHNPFVKDEASAVNRLWVTRQQQLAALKTELAYFAAVKPYLPPVLSEIVVGYLIDKDEVSVPRL